LCRWVVPLRMWPTMKIGGEAGPARCCALGKREGQPSDAASQRDT
jgi:hypothetical protein